MTINKILTDLTNLTNNLALFTSTAYISLSKQMNENDVDLSQQWVSLFPFVCKK